MTYHPNAVARSSVKSVIQLFGPNIASAIRSLKEIANTSPIVTNIDDVYTTASTLFVCIPTLYVDYPDPNRKRFTDYGEDLAQYLDSVDVGRPIAKTRLITKTSAKWGNSSFSFEWSRRPTKEEILDLIAQIDDALSPTGCRYTITTQ